MSAASTGEPIGVVTGSSHISDICLSGFSENEPEVVGGRDPDEVQSAFILTKRRWRRGINIWELVCRFNEMKAKLNHDLRFYRNTTVVVKKKG